MGKTKKLNLKSLYTIDAANEGFDVKLYDSVTLVDNGIVINVLGKDANEFQKVSSSQQKKRIAKMTKGGYRSQSFTLSPEEIELDALELLAKMTKRWSYEGKDTIPGPDGKEMELTVENAVLFYTESPASREQIDNAVGDRANLIKNL